MALIFCSSCGHQVSNKAKICPHCGYAFPDLNSANPTMKKCDDCGTVYDEKMSACPQCGCPNEGKPIVVEVKKKKHTGLIIVLLIVAILAVGYQRAKTTTYNYNMKTVSYLMLDGAADAESAGNLIKSVWYNAIYQEKDSATDKYTIVNGQFVDDFNDALTNLFYDAEFVSSISLIQENQNDVTVLMKKLRNPPKRYEEAYADLKTFYENYLKMTNMVINPTGSLQTFSDDFNAIDSGTVNSYNKMELHFD